jgi:uncharacterized protein YecE (DUF72 family)
MFAGCSPEYSRGRPGGKRPGADPGRIPDLRIGCAGWSVPKASASSFGVAGSHLERYAAALSAVEIDSSFHRPHRPETYARWAASVPPAFRFAVKVPREVTHVRRLRGAREPLESFLAGVRELGGRLGPLLIQLPPSLSFDAAVARDFFDLLRGLHAGPAACEPRHPSWMEDAAEELLRERGVARVAADPPRHPRATDPGGAPEPAYFRLHGSPRLYHSSYSAAYLEALAGRIREVSRRAGAVWCIFDNTAAGAAAANALDLAALLTRAP